MSLSSRPSLQHRCVARSPRILDLLEELAEAGTLYLPLSGGEALPRPDWDVVARRAQWLGFSLIVLTTGFLVDEGAADTLADLPAEVEVSVYSLDGR